LAPRDRARLAGVNCDDTGLTARVANRPDLDIYRSVLDADRQRDPRQDVLE
jgi:hypothetical protein